MATLKMKIIIKFNIRTLKTFIIWKLIFRVPKKGMSGLAYLKRGSMKYFQIHIFIIFRVHQLILNSRFLVSSILDLAYPLEACVLQASIWPDAFPWCVKGTQLIPPYALLFGWYSHLRHLSPPIVKQSPANVCSGKGNEYFQFQL